MPFSIWDEDCAGRVAIPQHLAFEAMLAPAEGDLHTERFGDGDAVALRHGPIHQRRSDFNTTDAACPIIVSSWVAETGFTAGVPPIVEFRHHGPQCRHRPLPHRGWCGAEPHRTSRTVGHWPSTMTKAAEGMLAEAQAHDQSTGIGPVPNDRSHGHMRPGQVRRPGWM